MEFGWSFKILIIIFLLLLLAFFSAAEVAFFVFDKKKVKEVFKHNRLLASYIENLLENTSRLLITLMLGTTFVTVGFSILAVILALEAAKFLNISSVTSIIVQIASLTILILLFGKIFPKMLANKNPAVILRIAAFPLYWISILFYPVTKILVNVLGFMTKIFESTNSSTALQENEITELAKMSVEQGTIEEGENELIHGIVSFKTVTAREIMTPRVDIAAVSLDESYQDLMNIINESGHSRIPLYENNLDNVLGVIYAKDLLPFLKNPDLRNNLNLKKIAREVIYVPSTKLINDLLHEFQEKKIHIGIVVDEYGGTAGLISLEDILEEIVGEIRDEHDREESEIVEINNTSFLVLGKVSIDEINELLEINLSSENDDYDTLGGFMLNQAGSIPKEGYETESSGFLFTVKEVVNNRINKIIVKKIVTE